MSASRPVAWVSSLLYAVVLIAGSYVWAVGSGDIRPAVLFGGVLALAGLDLLEHRRYPGRTPRIPAVGLLVVRVLLFVAVVAADGSGVSRVLFVLVPFTAYFTLGRTTSVALAVGCVALVVFANQVTMPHWYLTAEPVADLLMICIGLVLTVVMAGVAADSLRARVQLEQSHRQLREYAERVAQLSATSERNRLARDIHDGLGHHLVAISVLLEKASTFTERDPGQAQRALDDARRCARLALDDVRASVGALRADTSPFRLRPALTELTALAGSDAPTVTVTVDGDETGRPPAVLNTLFRAAQEGITNARRHAGATSVQVQVAFDAATARLVVADDGRGCSPVRLGSGLLGMRERVNLVGGQLDVDSAPGTGTRLMVTIPGPVAGLDQGGP